MLRVFFLTAVVTFVALAAMVQLDGKAADILRHDANEDWVDANLVRVNVNGRWEEFPLMPLSAQMCRSDERVYLRYCN
ncbi:MAG: hypothetical protein AAFX94_21810 [Myxococcota bacterium]